MSKKLNLGCGNRFRTEGWVNVDFSNPNPKVQKHDLRRPLPFASEEFTVVYHSHVLEHFSLTQGVVFLTECFRVLSGGGTIRSAVPDLESIAREYLRNLELAKAGDVKGAQNYEWIMLELYDQTVREYPGGKMAEYLKSPNLANKDYVLSRIGTEGENLIPSATDRSDCNRSSQSLTVPKNKLELTPFMKKLLLLPISILRNFKNTVINALGMTKKTASVALFRSCGEIHLWMYDEFSLSRALAECGFRDIKKVTAFVSRVPNWNLEMLDTNSDGSIYKPDSLFIEATKP